MATGRSAVASVLGSRVGNGEREKKARLTSGNVIDVDLTFNVHKDFEVKGRP